MADIIDVIRAEHRHIMIWQAELRELASQGSQLDRRQALASAWNTVAGLIDLHMTAEDEILRLPLRDTRTRDRAQVQRVLDAHGDIREIIRETCLQPPGSPQWCSLAAAALSAWAHEVEQQEQGLLPDFADRTSAGQRERLCRQWRAFMEARVRDQVPDAPSQVPACQLRRARPSPSVPPVAGIIFDPLYCTCRDCDLLAERIPSVLSVGRRHVPPPRPEPAVTGSPASPAAPGPLVVRTCVQVIAQVIGAGFADMANVQLVDPASGALRIIAQEGFGSQFLEFFEIVRGENSACGMALLKARPVWVPDVTRSPVFAGTPAGDIVLGANVRSVASVPVRAKDGSLIAMISTHRRKPGPWTQSQRRHLEGVAAQTGQLLSIAR